MCRQRGLHLGGCFRGVVVGDLKAYVVDVRILLDPVFEPLLTLIGSTGSSLKGNDKNLALLSNELGQGTSSGSASRNIVGGNCRDDLRRVIKCCINQRDFNDGVHCLSDRNK